MYPTQRIPEEGKDEKEHSKEDANVNSPVCRRQMVETSPEKASARGEHEALCK